MKIKREVLTGLCVILILTAGAVVLYNVVKGRERDGLARRIVSLGSRDGPPETIEGLREAIGRYERQIERHVEDAARTGTYWRILAVRLQDRGLHNEALGALERAVAYYPGDASLLYLTGLSAAAVAKSYLDFSGGAYNANAGSRYYALAEDAWLKAIALDGAYGRPRYALGVLYVFELNRPQDAIPVMERYLESAPLDADGMAVLAHAYALTGQYQAALDYYDRIIAVTGDAAKRAAAEESRQRVMDAYYGY
ncbi:MAG: tetratricopeptide repeat protein [Spirochaetaceae bacterium]|nr:tetratricopeptide repeat protein [Spirochaetaceae bacterium]